jgi:FAD/FMN-containing dehydrogenase
MSDSHPIIAELRRICGPDAVLTDADSLSVFSHDVYRAGKRPWAVVRPATVAALARAVGAATAADVAVFPRGGGMSYTDAYTPSVERAVVLDLRGLNRILAIKPDDMYVTVEAGCTWAALDAALKPHGLRPPFWGPFSGAKATVGGSLSQGTATFGSARVGPSDVAVIGLKVVLADGTIITTGSGGQPHHAPFFRHYGPDLTGLFTSDAGALGVKAEVTLQLERRPAAVHGLSYAFADAPSCFRAQAEAARSGLAGEVFAVDAELLRHSAGDPNLKRDLATLVQVGRSGGGGLAGLARMARLALAGRNFAAGIPFTCHFVTEANDAARLKANVAELRRLIAPHGVEIANTVPTVVRAHPFPPLAVAAPNGRRLLAIHAIVPFSAAAGVHAETAALVARHAAELRTGKVIVGYSFATVGRTGLLYEPVFYWEDELSLYHRRETPPDLLKAMQTFPANPAGRALVQRLRDAMVEIMYRHGAVHLQIGKAYPYLRERDPVFADVLRTIKRRVDPKGLMNPGALGLASPADA